jgi:hypothetical protein
MSCFWNRFGRHGALIRAATRGESSLLSRLADAPPRTFHVYAIALDHWLEAEPDIDPVTTGRRLVSQHLKEILQDVWGEVPQASLKVLNRCGNDVQPPEFYWSLQHCLSEPRLAALVRRGTGPVHTVSLERAEERALLDPALDEVRGPMSAELLAGLDWVVRRLRAIKGTAFNERLIRGILKNLERPTLKAQMVQLLRDFPAVGAPWPGDEHLRPIETVSELMATAGTMNNCLDHPRFALGLIRGTDAFYLLENRVAVHVQKSDVFGWGIAEMRGVANRPVPDVTRQAIQLTLERHGFNLTTDPLAGLSRFLEFA